MMVSHARRLWALIGFGRLRTLSLVTFSQGLVAIAFLLQMVLWSRILPLDEFGRLATLLAIANVVEAAVNARGNETAIAAYTLLPEGDRGLRDALTRRLMRIDLLWSAGALGLLTPTLILAGAAEGEQAEWLMVLMAGTFVAFPWGTLKSNLTVFRDPRAFLPVEMSYAVVTLTAGVGLSMAWGGLGAAIGVSLASLTRTFVAFRQTQVSPTTLFERAGERPPPVARSLWLFGLSGTVRAAIMNLAAQMDILLLSVASGPASVGLYRAAKTLSGMVPRLAQPLWFTLKRHVIAGSLEAGAPSGSRKMVVLAALGFAAAGVMLVPPVVIFSGEIAALTFGEMYRGAGQAIAWLVPGAWVASAVTGWSGLFGSVASTRATIIALYTTQVALFAAVALALGVTHATVALALALSQVLVAAGFWVLLFRSGERTDPAVA